MKQQELFAGLASNLPSSSNSLEVIDLVQDARKVQLGSVFVAIRGSKVDGHDFLPQAVRQGATAVVVESRAKLPSDFSGLVVEVADTRQALDVLASRFHGHPSQALFCVGITGTNGKTSTSYMVESLLQAGGFPTGVIGTVDHHLGDRVWPSDMTTPDPLALQSRLREFREAGAKAVALEVSSHALDQKRADQVAFDVGIFTNLTRDHLDYHPDLQHYFHAKEKLFRELLGRSFPEHRAKAATAVINLDDSWGRQIRLSQGVRLWTYGRKGADFDFQILDVSFAGTRFHLKTPFGQREFRLPLPGAHNVMNATAAIAAALAAGVGLDVCAEALDRFRGVPGRLEPVANRAELSIFVDYAHSPDALENVLSTLQRVRREQKKQMKIWTLFGCGGDRDKGKRPLMTRAALSQSDQIVITSDNPRSEDPRRIIQDMVEGLGGQELSRIHQEVDRREAIRWVLSQAQAGDVVLIAGKGHESTQTIGDQKIPFRDVDVTRDILTEMGMT